METEKTKCLIIGSGPAGYTAAIYAGRANLSPVLYEGLQPGGQLTTTTEVENFPGYPEGVTGPELMEDLKKQALRFGADIRNGIATAADLSNAPYKITFDGEKVVEADTLIIATGATAKYLGLEDEQKYSGMGVSACATCDGFFYRKKTVAVVGGGDTACEEAIYLAGLASKVYLIVRKPYLRASKIMQERVMDHPKIEVLFETNTVGLYGGAQIRPAHRRILPGHRTQTEFGYLQALCGNGRSGLHPDQRRFAPHPGTGSLRCRRRSRSSLPPGHHCCRKRLQGCYRSRTVFVGTRIVT